MVYTNWNVKALIKYYKCIHRSRFLFIFNQVLLSLILLAD